MDPLTPIYEALRLIAEDKLDDAQRILADFVSSPVPEGDVQPAPQAADPGYPPTKETLVSALKRAITLLNDGKTDEAIKVLLPLLGKDYGYPAKQAADPSEQAKQTLPIMLGEPQKEGRIWDVTLIEAGLSKNGFLYPAELLQESIHLFENLRCYDSHLTDEEMAKNPVRKVGDLLGWFDNAHWDDSRKAVRATFHAAAQWLRDLLLNLHHENRRDLLGFSIDSFVESIPRAIEGQVIRVVNKLVKLNSVDLVTQPAAGGSVDRLVASITPPSQPPAQDPSLANIEHRLYLMELKETLTASDLPKPAREFLYRQFSERIVPMHRLTSAIADQRKMLADLTPSTPVSASGSNIRDVRPASEVSDFAKDLAALCSWGEPGYKPRFRRLSEWYLALTGDEKFHGNVAPHRVTEANVTSSTMANVCADLLNKRLIDLYAEEKRWWEPLVTVHEEAFLQDVKLLHTEELAALATVAEGDPYVEKTWDDTKETVTFYKKGNYVGVTLESIMKDDIDAIKRIPQLLNRAWVNTVSGLVSEVFTTASGTGPLMADGARLFSTTHSNLITAALAFAAYSTAAQGMMAQTAPGSTRKLVVPPAFLLAPVQLYTTGRRIERSDKIPGSADNDINPWYDTFKTIAVPPWTDANDWAVVADPKQIECITLHYIQGQRTPEVFVSDSPTQGAMFTNDEIRFKVRAFVACGVADYRGLYKSNVT